ncbi:hypothetical protein V6N11_036798 [Hibiscus sabdariffa]|uniref:Uncharacterized protein n=1 Tax=Hibiscus sabdariffa TaxID=183260 RepID=A0ABR2RBG9_9ROSI
MNSTHTPSSLSFLSYTKLLKEILCLDCGGKAHDYSGQTCTYFDEEQRAQICPELEGRALRVNSGPPPPRTDDFSPRGSRGREDYSPTGARGREDHS